MGKADDAFNGIRTLIEFGVWKNIQEEKIVTFEGTSGSSSCWAEDRDGVRREGSLKTGAGKQELNVHKGETFRAMSGYVTFDDNPDS